MCIRDRSDGPDRPADLQPESAGLREALVFLVPCLDPELHRCLLYTSDAADERSSVDLGGRRIIKKKNTSRQVTKQV